MTKKPDVYESIIYDFLGKLDLLTQGELLYQILCPACSSFVAYDQNENLYYCKHVLCKMCHVLLPVKAFVSPTSYHVHKNMGDKRENIAMDMYAIYNRLIRHSTRTARKHGEHKGIISVMISARENLKYVSEVIDCISKKNRAVSVCPYCMEISCVPSGGGNMICSNNSCIAKQIGVEFNIEKRTTECENAKKSIAWYLKYIIRRKVALKLAERSLFIISAESYSAYMATL